MSLKLVRPEINGDNRAQLKRFLSDHWRRMVDARRDQVETKYRLWQQAWEATPAQKTRTFPWPNASNLRIPLVRMHADTFAARTMMLVFGTQPLIEVQGWPRELSEPFERYHNFKAINQWGMFDLANQFMTVGQKAGTSITKTVWTQDTDIDVMPDSDGASYTEEEIDLSCVKSKHVPFEDFYVYPIEAVQPEDVKIWASRTYYTPEDAKYQVDRGRWDWPWERADQGDKRTPLKNYLKTGTSAKREVEQSKAGVSDSLARHLETVELYLRWPVMADPNKYYSIVVTWVPDMEDFIDLYFNPFPRNMRCFSIYRPAPREGLFYGDSWVEMLQSFQEQVTTIHNDRRDNAKLSNTSIFLRKTGTQGIDSVIYPGKEIVVDSMDDFQVMEFGRAHPETLNEEVHVLGLAERITGINAAMQGSSAGATGKRGVYSAQGTMALLSETNDRQGLGVKMFRNALGEINKNSAILQCVFGANDPTLQFFEPEEREKIQAAIAYMAKNSARLHLTPFSIRTSTAASNQEIERQNLFQVMGVFERYYQQAMSISTQLLNPGLNPQLRQIYAETLRSMQDLGRRVMQAFNENEPEKILPDYAAVVSPQAQQEEMGGDFDPGARTASDGPLTPAGLANFDRAASGATGGGGGYPS